MNEVTNKHIDPDPNLMEKVPAQMMIYDGSKWLEISNQQTINSLNDTTVDLQQEAKEVRTYVDNVDSDFKKAQKAINDTIATETTRLDKSISDAKLDTKSVNDRLTQINADSQKTISEIQTNLSNIDINVTEIDKKIDNATAESQKLIEDLQKQASDLKLNVADQFDQKSIEIQTAKQQAIANADQALKEYQTQVQTQFSSVDGKISQTVRKTDYDQLSKLVTANETRSIQNQNAIELKADKTSVDAANTKITDLESSLSVANDAIKARAKQTDIDKLTDRVSSAEASLTVNANNISLKADKASVDNLDQQVKNISSAMLTVDSDQIKSLVNSTNANSGQIAVLSTQTQQNKDTIKTLASKTDLDLLTNTVNQAKSEWTQSSDGIKASISAVGSKLTNLSFGGRNLLKQSQLGSNYKHDAWYETFGGVTWNSDTVELNIGDKDCVQIEQRVYDIEPDTDYVFSFDLNYADGQHLDKQGFIFWEFTANDFKQNTKVYKDNWNIANMSNFPNTPGRVGKKLVLHTQPDTHALIFMVRSVKGAKQPFRISKVKFEKGNVATDWTPAPEDIDSQLNSVNNTLTTYKTDFDLLKDGMTLRVAEISKLNDQINGLKVGGRNYLQGSLDFTWPTGIGQNNVTPTFEMQGETKVAHLNSQYFGGIYTKWGGAFPNGELQVGDDYTLSFDAKGTGVFKTVKNESEASDGSLSGTSLTSNWKRYSVSGKINSLNKAYVIYFNAGYDAYIRHVKIEKGNKPTDYTRAPEDITNDINSKYASLNVRIDSINSTVATKADKSYVDQTATNITNVVANKADKSYVEQTAKAITNVVSTKADTSYVNQKADQWQLALQNAQNDLSGKITATKNDLSTLYNSDTYKGMQKIVQNSAFLQNANGFTSQVQQLIGDQLKQANLVYNSEFIAGTDSVIDGWTTNFGLKRGTNRYDNYNGSTTLGMDASGNADDRWVNGWSSFIAVEPGETVSASVVVFYTGNVPHSGICGLELEFWANASDQYRKSNKMTTVNVSDVPYDHAKLLKLENITIPNGINQVRVSLIIRGKGNVMFAHPMFVKGSSVGVYQASTVGQFSKLTQTIAGLKAEVHDNSNNSVIAQTARMIALQVSGDKNKIISQINASTEGVMIDGKHVMINGNTRIQGTLMVNDVVMRSQNNAVKFSPSSLDMVGANSMLKLQNDSIHLGSTSSDPRQQWGMKLSDDGLELSVPAKKLGATTNNPSDYNHEIQGYIKGGGWDYRKMDTVGNGASGIEMGLMTKQVWGAPYGGDYIAIGQYIPSSSGGKILQPAISYSETGFGWAPKDLHIYKPTYFGSEVHFGAGSAQNGIRTAWVSWSDWNNEKYPCFVNDNGNWGGIAFPQNGNVVLFNHAGKRYNIYETKDNKLYNNYGGY
ncbi:hypothetical protein [Ligilactobacillus faecis]|uniref:hypothetical protein n=1 Tax=Ligilactobacillus faecis TaxID=762833 RepID=UPI002469C230|nr:hypothetical protein [Ligilactobacillus faecis]WGN89043.1 hypothetical protein QFX10_08295 [Ligilactobacillus faecis]